MAVVCAWTEGVEPAAEELEPTMAAAIEVLAGSVEKTDPGGTAAVAAFEVPARELLDEIEELSVCKLEVPGVVFRGVGNRIGVTATTSAVSNNAIESLLSIYGTGSKPPGRKG